jgi:hypothetical protein
MKTGGAKKIWTAAALVAIAAMANAQELQSRVFTYDGTPATNGAITFQIEGSAFTPAGTLVTANSSISNESPNGASLGVNLAINVETYIYVFGSLYAKYTVSGAGGTRDQLRAADLEIRTNRNLTISTANFTGLSDSTHPGDASGIGEIAYTLSLYGGFPLQAEALPISQSATGKDADFNGKSVSLQVSELPPSGQATLRLGRTLTIGSAAQGSTTYRATGTLILTVS